MMNGLRLLIILLDGAKTTCNIGKLGKNMNEKVNVEDRTRAVEKKDGCQ